MPFLKQTLMWGFFLAAIYFGCVSSQSSSTLLQGMGFASAVMAFVCLYIILKLMWCARGTVITVSLLAVVTFYCVYAMGLPGKKADVPAAQQQSGSAAENIAAPETAESELEDLEYELFGDGVPQKDTAAAQNQPPAQDGGLVGKITAALFGSGGQQKVQTPVPMDINPFDYPAVEGYARVVTASVLNVQGLNIKMYGIDAPDLSQTCANHFGSGYYCGREARNWLQNWIGRRPVSCRILGKVENGWATGVCFVDNNKYDVAAVTVNAGWAVAYTQNTGVYASYERQASENRRGLWAGTFYKPWDWRKIQNRKVEIKVKYTAPKPVKKSKKFDFWGLF